MRPGVAYLCYYLIAAQNMPTLQNIKQVSQFLGLAGFFRKFVKNFAVIIRPLTQLLQKNNQWNWTAEQDIAVQAVKDISTTRPVLKIFDPNLMTEVHTDVSKDGIAGMLIQVDENNKKHVVAYYSRQTTALEKKFHSYETETLAVVESCRYIRVYLIGIKFKLITDS